MMSSETSSHKSCACCKERKPLSEFNKDKSKKDGVRCSCKSCQSKRRKDDYNKRKSFYLKKNKKAYNSRKNRADITHNETYSKRCACCNKEKNYKSFTKNKNTKDQLEYYCRSCNSIKKKEQAKKHKDRISKYRKEYYSRDDIKKNKAEYQKKYWKKNKKELTDKALYRHHKRVKEDAVYALKCRISSGIRKSFQYSANCIKKNRSNDILCCDYVFLKNWLLDVSNVKEIDILKNDVDHVIPLSLAKTEEEVLALNHYSNLQLLEKVENRVIKRNGYIKYPNLCRVLSNHNNPNLLKNIVSRSDIEIKYQDDEPDDIATNTQKSANGGGGLGMPKAPNVRAVPRPSDDAQRNARQ